MAKTCAAARLSQQGDMHGGLVMAGGTALTAVVPSQRTYAKFMLPLAHATHSLSLSLSSWNRRSAAAPLRMRGMHAPSCRIGRRTALGQRPRAVCMLAATSGAEMCRGSGFRIAT
jgi:hypothetical protein